MKKINPFGLAALQEPNEFSDIAHEGYCPAFKVAEQYAPNGACLGHSAPLSKHLGGNFDPSAVDAPPFVDLADPVSAASVASIEANLGAFYAGDPLSIADTCKELANQINV